MAKYYDLIYKNLVDYEGQTDYLEKIVRKLKNGRVDSIIEIACGTGNYAFILAKRGYRVTGIDSSREMIEIARRKGRGSSNPRFIKMDMRDITLDENFDIATVLFGGFGYLLERRDLGRFFSGVRNVLRPNGLLLFEFWHNAAILPEATTPSGRKMYDVSVSGSRKIIRLHTSRYDPQSSIDTILFDMYVVDTKKNRLLDSFSETHSVRTYSIPQMKDLLVENKFKPLGFYAGGVEKIQKPELAKQSTFRVLAVAKV